MKELIEYNNKRIILTAYNIKTERDLLLTAISSESDDYNMFLRLLHPNIEIYIKDKDNWQNTSVYNISNSEKLFILYRLRAISVSDMLNINTTCGCGMSFKTKINLNDIAKFGNIKNEELKNIYSDDYQDYFYNDIDSYNLSKYEELEDFIIQNGTKFEFKKQINCPQCKSNITIDLKLPIIYKNCFSENSISELYKSITRLSFLGKLSISGILNDLYPFERDIFINQINNEIEESNKQKNNNPK